jgi:hypothetical protein
MGITDDDAERAMDFLRDNATEAAQAKANRLHLTEYRKSLKAKLMGERTLDPLGAQERHAYAHKEYLDLLLAIKDAVFQDEKQQWLMEAAKAKIDVWRSLNANLRPRL